MVAFAIESWSAAALCRVARGLRASGRMLADAAARLERRFERRSEEAAVRGSDASGDHELFDIGLARIELDCGLQGAHEPVLHRPLQRVRTRSATDGRARSALVRSVLWLHAGLVGASLAVAGVVQACGGEWRFAVPLAFIGAPIASFAWRRGRAVLAALDLEAAQ